MALASVLVACAQARSAGGLGQGPGRIGHPTGPTQLVLRIKATGGFVSPTVMATRLPDISLFGDGTMVTTGPVPEIYPGPALPKLLARTLTEPGMQALLRAAAGAGLLGPDRSYRTMTISDMPTTVFTLVAEGRRHVVSVYGLGIAASPLVSAPERKARRALLAFERGLFGLSSLLPKGSFYKERPFEPTALSVFVRPYQAVADPNLSEPTTRWPLAGSLATFGRPANDFSASRCGMVRGTDATSVLELAKHANQLTPWSSGGREFALFFRPLLPDEHGC